MQDNIVAIWINTIIELHVHCTCPACPNIEEKVVLNTTIKFITFLPQKVQALLASVWLYLLPNTYIAPRGPGKGDQGTSQS